MNFLAHAYLSFGEAPVLAGNMLADFIRGKQQYLLEPPIREGLMLHRAIDAFTDAHESTRRASGYMKAACGRYSGVFTDVIYDHFLALDPRYFSRGSLKSFAAHTYGTLETFRGIFPERFSRVFLYMKRDDWLYGYRFRENIGGAFRGIYHRAKYLAESADGFKTFERYYEELRSCYETFMPDLTTFAGTYLQTTRQRNFASDGRVE